MANVIHLFGASGAGTTTLGKYVAEQLGYFFMDTDDYYWYKTDPAYTKRRPQQECVALMQEEIEKHSAVVLSGALCKWGDELIPNFSIVVYVETDTNTRLSRLQQREQLTYGNRIATGGDMYSDHMSFLKWASLYDDNSTEVRNKSLHYQWKQKLPCKTIDVDGSAPLHDNFLTIKENIDYIPTKKHTVKTFWQNIADKKWDELSTHFSPNAVIKWHNTSEQFTVQEFVEVNRTYPGNWNIAMEKLLKIDNTLVTVTKVTSLETSFYATSFFTFKDNRIVQLDEYWGENTQPPEWRRN